MTDDDAAPAELPEREDAEVFVCRDLDRAIAWFTRLGLRLDTISPADDPAMAWLSGPSGCVRLLRAGARVDDAPATWQPAFVVVRAGETPWRTGRAGMQYRDLIPDRQGGRIIASHIRIPDGGPVPDYVHYHAVELQLIYCHQGWVRVVYEDQGEPFVMQAGECVLQPPQIRHRVLEASAGLEVIELGVPAVHATHVDHDRALPTPERRPERSFDGQRFVRFVPAAARFAPSPIAGLDACELGVAAATGGRASVHLLRAAGAAGPLGARPYHHRAELLFHVVLRGEVTLDGTHRLGAADAVVIPAGRAFAWSAATRDLELLAVALPGDLSIAPVG